MSARLWSEDCLAAEAEVQRLRAELAARQAEGKYLADEVEALRAAADAPPYVDCICPGCPRKVPQAWASGMCEPCCAEDCEHTDGARAVAIERDLLREQLAGAEAEVEARRASEALLAAALKRADAEVERVRGEHGAMHRDFLAALNERDRYAARCSGQTDTVAAATVERDRLAAVLADVVKVLDAPDGHATWATLWEARENAQELAEDALRARAGQS